MSKRTIFELCLMAAVAVTFFLFGHRTAASVLGVLFSLVLLMALFAPSALKTFQELVKRAGVWVGTAIGVVLLTLVYFVIFVPSALCLRLLGIDFMSREFPGKGSSNWIERVDYGKDKLLYAKPYTRPHAGEPPRGAGA
jgi:hypothetical protein